MQAQEQEKEANPIIGPFDRAAWKTLHAYKNAIKIMESRNHPGLYADTIKDDKKTLKQIINGEITFH